MIENNATVTSKMINYKTKKKIKNSDFVFVENIVLFAGLLFPHINSIYHLVLFSQKESRNFQIHQVVDLIEDRNDVISFFIVYKQNRKSLKNTFTANIKESLV